MTKKSWSVTLTPLLIAIFTLAQAYLNNRTPTEQEVQIFIGALIAFVTSGIIGAKVAIAKKKN